LYRAPAVESKGKRIARAANRDAGKLYVLAVMDHAEYGEEKWKGDMIRKKTAGIAPSKAYFDLVKAFPLLPIADDDHLRRAMEMLDYALTLDPSDPGVDGYVEVLSDLIEARERAHLEIPDASEAEVLQVLMEMRGVTQTDLEKATGLAQETISNVLRGVRTLTKKQVVLFAEYFNVGVGAFMRTPADKSTSE
jgi:antitoxin component HigA of HigAB toxin-antitoxin module